jgi:hypothetical protein
MDFTKQEVFWYSLCVVVALCTILGATYLGVASWLSDEDAASERDRSVSHQTIRQDTGPGSP